MLIIFDKSIVARLGIPVFEAWLVTAAMSIVLGVAGLYLLFKRRKATSAYDRLPGPRRRTPLGGYLNLVDMSDEKKFMKLLDKWEAEYGPTYRINFGPTEFLSVASPKHVQKICSAPEVQMWGKPFFFDISRPVPWFDGLLHSKGAKWKSRRKLINPIMDHKSLMGYTPILNQEGRAAVVKLEALFATSSGGGAPRPRPIQSVLQGTALNCICKAAFGTDASKGELLYDPETIIGATRAVFEALSTRLATPWLIPDPIFRLHPLSKAVKDFVTLSTNLVEDLIQKYKEEQKDESKNLKEEDPDGGGSLRRTSMLYDLMLAGLPFEGIYEEVITMIIAGYETTAGILHHLLFLLALNPEAQRRAREEVDQVFQNEDLCPDGEELSSAALKQLHYLEQCVMETLRILPTAYAILRKVESSPFHLDEDLVLPVGTNIYVGLKALHMNPDLFPSPEKFNPDRFSAEERGQRQAYTYLPFSAGPKICIGHKFAMMELLTLSSRIIRHFEIGTTTKFEDVIFLPSITLIPEKPMDFVLKKRDEIML